MTAIPIQNQNQDQAPTSARRTTPATRVRVWIALTGAAAVFVLTVLAILPGVYTLPVVGVLLALAGPPDHVPEARPIAFNRWNAVLAITLWATLSVLIWRPQLLLSLVQLLGIDGSGLVLMLLPFVCLALPLAMTQAPSRIDDLPVNRVALTHRNLILSLTVIVTVAGWYAGPGLSPLPIAALVVGLPVLLAAARLVAARRGRLEHGLWRHPRRAGLGLHRLQLVNVLLLCLLLALVLRTGTYDATVLELSSGAHRVFQAAFLTGLVALVLIALVPLRRVRLGSNLLVLAGSMFVAAQLVVLYRPAVDPVTIASPLAEEWYVGQGGHAELINYHVVTSTQSDALDIMQVVDGRTHRPGSTGLDAYYIYDQPVLAPADGVVSYVLDGRPDLPVGSADSRYQAGNQVVIDLGGNRYLMVGHLRQDSIQVKVGDRVGIGQPIARVGNSGNTTEPHIHIQAQSIPTGIGDVQAIDDIVAFVRALRTYPLTFHDVVLTRGDTQTRPAAADPRRGDLIRPIS